jgi:pimeloyl-ACP methyl ester carboxylesterase
MYFFHPSRIRPERLRELAHIPTLVLSAQDDPIALPAYGQELSARIPGSRYVEMPNAFHGVTIQMPVQVNNLLRLHFSG